MADYKTLVGEFVLLFGSLEHTVCCSVIQIIFKNCPSKSRKYYNVLEVLLKNNEFSTNLNYLKYFVGEFVEEQHKNNWYELIKDLERTMRMRNLIVHEMGGLENDVLVKRKTSHSLKKHAEYIEISGEELQEAYNVLSERYRQLFDSIFDAPYAAKNNLKFTWISEFPQLYW